MKNRLGVVPVGHKLEVWTMWGYRSPGGVMVQPLHKQTESSAQKPTTKGTASVETIGGVRAW